jgi:hypothetical protein
MSTRIQEGADELQQTLVRNPLGNQLHQNVVVDPIEKARIVSQCSFR